MFSFFRKFLATPWATLIPLAGICAVALVGFSGLSSRYLAAQYERQMFQAAEHEIEEIAEKIGKLGESGVSVLVRHLASPRRAIVAASRNALEREFTRWSQEKPDLAAPMNLAFARSLAENIENYEPGSRLLAASYARRVMKSMLLDSEEKYPHREQIANYCETIFRKTEGESFVRRNPSRLDLMYQGIQGGEPQYVVSPDPQDVEKLIAANYRRDREKLPRNPQRIEAIANDDYFDPYFAPRAEALYAAHQSRLQRLKNAPDVFHEPWERSLPDSDGDFPEGTMLAQGNAVTESGALFEGNVPGERLFGDSESQATLSQPYDRIASQYGRDSEPSPARQDVAQDVWDGIPEDEKLPRLPAYRDERANTFSDTTYGESSPERSTEFFGKGVPGEDANPYAPEPVEHTALGRTAKDEIEHLRTSELIRLLQHPDRGIQALAEQRLRHRDGFQNIHVKLACKLYHPNVNQRRELLELLPRTPSVEPLPWLMELLHDPHPEIRLAAITFVATTQDMELVRNLIEKAKRDDDPRINALVQKLETLRRARLTNW